MTRHELIHAIMMQVNYATNDIDTLAEVNQRLLQTSDQVLREIYETGAVAEAVARAKFNLLDTDEAQPS